jgi:hypothetical protein
MMLQIEEIPHARISPKAEGRKRRHWKRGAASPTTSVAGMLESYMHDLHHKYEEHR